MDPVTSVEIFIGVHANTLALSVLPIVCVVLYVRFCMRNIVCVRFCICVLVFVFFNACSCIAYLLKYICLYFFVFVCVCFCLFVFVCFCLCLFVFVSVFSVRFHLCVSEYFNVMNMYMYV